MKVISLWNRKWLIAVAALSIVGGWTLSRLTNAKPSSGIVESSGFVEGPRIVLSAQVPGAVFEMRVKEGLLVKKNQLMATLDAAQLKAKVDQAKAQLAIAANQVEQAQANVKAQSSKKEEAYLAVNLAEQAHAGKMAQARAALEASKALLERSRVALEQARDDHRRYKELYREKAISQAQIRAIENKVAEAQAQYEASRQHAEEAEASLKLAHVGEVSTDVQRKTAESAEAILVQAEAALRVARSNGQLAGAVLTEAEAILAKTEIHAPSEGTVVKKLVEEGEVVSTGTPLMELVNTRELKLTVYVSGKEIGKVKLGQQAQIYIDSFPGKPFTGQVTRVAQEAEFTPENVHMRDERVKLVYAVEIGLSNSDGSIKPGMPADAKILTGL